MMNADEVKALRERLGLSQTQFARQLGTTATSVSQWETGRAKPRLMAIHAMENLTKPTTRSFGEDEPVYDAG